MNEKGNFWIVFPGTGSALADSDGLSLPLLKNNTERVR